MQKSKVAARRKPTPKSAGAGILHAPDARSGSESQLPEDFSTLAGSGSRLRFLEGLSKPHRDTVLAAATQRRFGYDSTVFHQGAPADKLFLLLKGHARFFFITLGGRKVYLLWLRPGEIFGAASLLTNPGRFLVSAEVTKDSHVLVWQRNAIRNLAAQHPRLSENALSIASDYLVWYLASHLSLICHNARQRLAHVLTSLAAGIGRKESGGIRLQITNEQLANTANITLFTASRPLSEWQRMGIIVKNRGGVLLCHPERLFFAGEGSGAEITFAGPTL